MKLSSPLLMGKISDYVPYRNTKAYIAQKSALIRDPGFKNSFDENETLSELMRLCSFTRPDRFRAERRRWDSLESPVPLKYFSAIGVSLSVLNFTVELDQDEFDRALESLPYPDHFIIRLSQASFVRYSIPEQIYDSEKEQFVAAFSEESGLECRMHFGEMKSFIVHPGGRSETVLYLPVFSVSNSRVYFKTRRDEHAGVLT